MPSTKWSIAWAQLRKPIMRRLSASWGLADPARVDMDSPKRAGVHAYTDPGAPPIRISQGWRAYVAPHGAKRNAGRRPRITPRSIQVTTPSIQRPPKPGHRDHHRHQHQPGERERVVMELVDGRALEHDGAHHAQVVGERQAFA